MSRRYVQSSLSCDGSARPNIYIAPIPSSLLWQVCATLASNPRIKIVFLCSPGNPTGTLLPLASIKRVLDCADYKGLVVVDEAYIDFAEEEMRMGARDKDVPVSAVELTKEYANVIVTQTLSKSFGLAAIR